MPSRCVHSEPFSLSWSQVHFDRRDIPVSTYLLRFDKARLGYLFTRTQDGLHRGQEAFHQWDPQLCVGGFFSYNLPYISSLFFFLGAMPSAEYPPAWNHSLGMCSQHIIVSYIAPQRVALGADEHRWSVSWRCSLAELFFNFSKNKQAPLDDVSYAMGYHLNLKVWPRRCRDGEVQRGDSTVRLVTRVPGYEFSHLAPISPASSVQMWSRYPESYLRVSIPSAQTGEIDRRRWYEGLVANSAICPPIEPNHSAYSVDADLSATIPLEWKGPYKRMVSVKQSIVDLGHLAKQLRAYVNVQEVFIQARTVKVPTKLVFPCSLAVDQLESSDGVLRIGFLQVHGHLTWSFPGRVELYSRLYIEGDCACYFDEFGTHATSQISVEGRFGYLSGLHENTGRGVWRHEGDLFARQVFVYATRQSMDIEGAVFPFSGGLFVEAQTQSFGQAHPVQSREASLSVERRGVFKPEFSVCSPLVQYRSIADDPTLQEYYRNEVLKQNRNLLICERMASVNESSQVEFQSLEPYPKEWLDRLRDRNKILSKLWEIAKLTDLFGLFSDSQRECKPFESISGELIYQAIGTHVRLEPHLITVASLTSLEAISDIQPSLEQRLLKFVAKVGEQFDQFMQSICTFNLTQKVLRPYLQALKLERINVELLEGLIAPFLEDAEVCNNQ